MEQITIGQVATYLAFLVGIIGSISYFVKPIKSFSARVDDLEEKRDKDFVRLNTLEQDNKMLLKSMIAILGHLETNNNTDKMKAVRKELEDYIISK